MVDSPDLDRFVPLAGRLAEASGAAIRPHFRTPVAVDDKADASPVTIADREAEAAMRAVLNQEVPDHGILGEEYGPENLDAEYVWVLDPIDGTKAFITGMWTFGTLIALCHRGRPVLGVVDQPITGDRWVAAMGGGTFRNGVALATRPCPTLDRAVLGVTSPDMFVGEDAAAFARLEQAVKLRRFGGDCINYASLAGGFVDLVAEAQLQPYDYCAHVPLITAAGGVITDWQGAPLTLESQGGRVVAAGDADLHAAAIAALAG